MPSGRSPRSAAAALLFCLGFLWLTDSRAADVHDWQVETHDLAAADIAATHALIQTVAEVLPSRLSSDLRSSTRVGWGALPMDVHGRAFGDRVWLQRDLLPAWRTLSEQDTGSRRDSPAVHALIHEIAHRYDRSATGRVSSDPRFLDLAGWPRRPWFWGGRGSHNGFVDRSPDAYELTSPREFFAVNLEAFLLDAQYRCRRPALHRYFAARFGEPAARAECADDQVFVTPGSAGGLSEAEALDPARVYAIDYLLAEGNTQPMSRWGHSMLRLVICAPERAPGPDCRLDLAYHRVLSFRAFVGDVQISSWRGLTGSYPSRLFVLPLDQVIDEYTRVELRGLRSMPLRLSKDEIAQLLERAAQLHWSYDGRYYFLGNNCAVETWRLLQDGVPRLAQRRLRGIAPDGLARRLERTGVVDASVPRDPAEAERLGYYFAPASARFDAMFAAAKATLPLPKDDAQTWLDASPDVRRPWLERGDLRASAALLVLEEAALRREELRVRDVLKRRLLDPGEGDTARDDVQAWLLNGEFLSRPASLLPDGYGLPQAQERAVLMREVSERGRRLQSEDEAMRAAARAWLPADAKARLEATEANVAAIGARLRQLAAP